MFLPCPQVCPPLCLVNFPCGCKMTLAASYLTNMSNTQKRESLFRWHFVKNKGTSFPANHIWDLLEANIFWDCTSLISDGLRSGYLSPNELIIELYLTDHSDGLCMSM